ncbi:hypothetical protein ACLOJK_031938 [Asimina triloba]
MLIGGAGLLPNGNFEHGPNRSRMNGTVVIGRDAIPQWWTTGFVEYIESGHKQGDMLLVVPEGYYAVRLGNEASIMQRVSVQPGMYYTLSFTAARTCAQEERLNVSVAPDSGVLPMQTMYSSSGWDAYAWAFKAVYPVVEVVIHNPGMEEDPACGPLIDSVAMKALYPPRPTSKNLLKNGGFEEGPYIFPNTSWGVLIPPNIEDDNSPLPGWMIESLKAVKYIDSDDYTVPQGRRAVELVGGKESAIAQVARTVVGRIYVLTFAVGDGSSSCEGTMIVEAFAGKDTVKVPYDSKGKGGFKRAVLKFTAVSARTRIMFLSTFYTMTTDGSLCGPVIDDVKLSDEHADAKIFRHLARATHPQVRARFFLFVPLKCHPFYQSHKSNRSITRFPDALAPGPWLTISSEVGSIYEAGEEVGMTNPQFGKDSSPPYMDWIGLGTAFNGLVEAPNLTTGTVYPLNADTCLHSDACKPKRAPFDQAGTLKNHAEPRSGNRILRRRLRSLRRDLIQRLTKSRLFEARRKS